MLKKKQLKNKSFIIAEVGQNHQGNVKIAGDYVKCFSQIGADVIKFQTRENKSLFSKDAYNKVYNSENAFADIYGKHREKLELNKKQLIFLKKQCKKHKVKFMSTPFDKTSLKLLLDIGVDLIKIASFDLGNLSLIEKIAKSKLPTVLSTGGGKLDHIKASVKILSKYNSNIAILHCVSEYPCKIENLGLEKIKTLVKLFPKYSIGLSDHFNGILSGPLAHMMGARVFEKHVTLNRAWKGSDHKFALEPNGFRLFTRDINRVPLMMNEKKANQIGREPVFEKLGKSIIATKNLKKGKKIALDDIDGMIFEKQIIPIRETYKILNKKLKKDLLKGQPLFLSDLK
jgi:sialic acid synthase